MSKTIDERVVSMQFDNKRFESNVKVTLSSLDKLKEKLHFKDAAKGFENISNAASKVNMNGLNKAIDTVHASFSALDVMGVTALANLTNSAVNAGKKIVSALTIDPIKTGFQEYETQINAVQTILANTQSKGTTLNDVNKALDELNHYADLTIYNFTEMTKNIGTFTAAGVDLDTSVSAIKGISNLAALSGSNSQQASTAMYQLSQALAAGTVKLQDWNSVVNAGMGGQVFQDSLKETARVHGIAIDQMIKDEGSFRETLSKGWLTSDVLTETLSKFTGDLNEKQLKTMGYSEEQVKSITKLGQTANDAATKVKTFSQLWDTLKESAQSGWTQSWEIIIGDFDEAKTLLTEVSESIGGIIGRSADARNKVLQGWKDLGGRTAVIDALKNAFEGIGSIVKPISEAFRDIFPPTTSEQLYNFSVGLKELTSKLKVSDETAKNIKNTFKGVFSVISLVTDAISAVVRGSFNLLSSITGISGGILGVTGAFGDFISKISISIKEANVFGKSINAITNIVSGTITHIQELWSTIAKTLSNSESYKGIAKAMTGIAEGFSSIDFSKGIGVLNEGVFTGILLGIRKFIKGMTDPFKGVGGFLENITGILDDVRGCFEAYQNQLKAGTLLKIASAIAILTGSILIISTINGEALAKSLGAITIMFGQLLGSLSLFSKISTTFTGVAKGIPLMIGMSTAITILSIALKKLSSIDTAGLIKGIVGIGALMLELSLFLKTYKFDGKLTGTAIGIVVLSSAMLILSKAVKNFGAMNLSEIGKGLLSIGLLLTEITVFTKYTGNAKNIISTAVSMIFIGEAMNKFATAISSLGSMSLESLAKGMSAMALALVGTSMAMKLMPNNTLLIGAGLIAVAESMKILSESVSSFGNISWEDIGRGLTVMGLSLAELAIALKCMNGTIAGSAALIVAAGALAILAPAIKTLSSLSWDGLFKSLLTLAGTFSIIGVAGMALGPLIPSLLGLGSAFSLLGIATFGIGAGLAAIATGLTSLAVAGTAGATAAVASLHIIISGIIDLIPTIAEKLGEGIIVLAQTLAKSATVIADSVLIMVSEVLASLAKYTPKIVDSIIDFIIGILDSLAEKLPKLIQSAVKVIGAFFQGIVDALGGMDFSTLVKGIAGVGLLSGLMLALATVAGMIPGAMAGVLGMGVVIAELALVLAAVGAFAQIPGLSWLINEGGNFLQTIGTAIGKFFGGIASGFTNALSSSFPKLGSELSAFIINAKPFIEGVKQIDDSMLNGVQALTKSIMALTAANVLDGIVSWLMGGSSLTRFGEELVPFGQSMRKYANTVVGIDSGVIAASATAANSLVELAKNIPNSGGLISLFTGDNNLNTFGNQLPEFGKSMKDYANSISGIDSDAVAASSSAAKSLVELAENLPKSGGLISLFTGERDFSSFGQQLVTFGKSMNDYSKNISGMDMSAVTASASAGKALAELANNLPGSMGLLNVITGNKNLALFGAQLPTFGKGMSEYSEAISGIDAKAVESSAIAARSLSELANNLPSTGGLLSLFTGDKNLLTFGKQLKPFGENMNEYSKSISGIDAKSVEASATAASALSELASNLPKSGGLFKYFTGKSDLITFSKQLKPFGNAMKEYSESISGIDDKAVTASATVAKSLSELAKNLPKTGGLAELFTGSNDLSKFSKQLKPFGEGMKEYANAVSGIDDKAVTASANAAKSLSELAANLPKKGGVVNWFTGESDISQFGSQLKSFGSSMKEYSNAVTGIDDKAIIASSTAAKSLAELVENLPASGEISKWFAGENNLTVFGNQLPEFGKKIKEYADAVGTIDGSSVEASTNAAKTLAELANNLPPDQGSIAAWFNGNNNLENFGNQLKGFGGCMKAYAEAVKGIEPASVEASANAAKVLGELANNLPPSSSEIIKTLMGEKSLTAFGNQLPKFGEQMSAYAEQVKAIKPEAVVASANAAKTLSELVNNLPPSPGEIIKTLMDEKSLTAFGDQLPKFGEQMSAYANAVSGIDDKSVTASATAAKVLGELAMNLPPSTDSLFSLFNGQQTLDSFGKLLPSFGESLKNYSVNVEGVNAQAITDSAKGAQELVKVIQSFSGISGSLGMFTNAAGLAIIVTQLSPVGAAMKSYSEAVNGIKADSITESTKGAQALVTLINNTAGINVSGVEPFKKAINSLSSIQINDFIKSFNDISAKFTNVGNNMVDAIVSGINSKKASLTSTAENLVALFVKSVDNKIPSFKSTGTKCITEFVSGIKSKAKDINSAFVDGVKNVITSIKSYNTDFYNAGSYLVSGFANGISANTYRAAAVAGEMASAAARAARRELDEHSPSKVGYEIGDYFGVAFVNAIGDYSRKAYSASSEMAGSARAGLSNAIRKISQIINSDMDNQPTIRPVLDLSEVSSGVGSINRMFNSSRDFSATVSRAQSISMMMNASQNGANDDIISAIKDLKRTVNSLSSGDSYNINGVTYDDGSNVASAVKSLVRAAKIERRK
jgi:tape measure domain-containing protein